MVGDQDPQPGRRVSHKRAVLFGACEQGAYGGEDAAHAGGSEFLSLAEVGDEVAEGGGVDAVKRHGAEVGDGESLKRVPVALAGDL